MRTQTSTSLTLLASLLILAGCSVAPTYQRPDAAVPETFKEAPTTDSAWKTAQPAEEIPRGEWWKIFRDQTLDDL